MIIEILTPYTSFLLGLLASVSSCLAVVGGLVLSLSAKVAEDDKRNTRVFYLFHFGRLAGFAVFGGALGALGGLVAISQTVVSGLTIVAALVMLLLGLNLVGLLSGKTVKLPRSIFNSFTKLEHSTLAPLLLGVGTFFFPCGFTQSAQIAALASGSFWSGALIMTAFALGTLPMLLALSFGSVALADTRYARVFFKVAGVVVLIFGIFALWSSLTALGVVRPLSFSGSEAAEEGVAVVEDGVQQAIITAHNGYTPQVTRLRAGVPSRLRVRTENTYDCSAALSIPAVGYREFLSPTGEVMIDLGTRAPGEEIQGGCSMGMYSFLLRFE